MSTDRPPTPTGGWIELFPELYEFLESEVADAVDPYGWTYYSALDLSWYEYGVEGISRQLLYIASNLKPKHKVVEKRLVLWSKRLDRVEVEEES